MATFLLGLWIGGTLGALLMACVAASADRSDDCRERDHPKRHVIRRLPKRHVARRRATADEISKVLEFQRRASSKLSLH